MRRPQLPSYKLLLLSLLGILTVQTALSAIMRYSQSTPSLFAAVSYTVAGVKAQTGYGSCNTETNVSLSWYPPATTQINDLAGVVNGTGVYGFIFNSSQGPLDTYNWCNMPHMNPTTYPKVNDSSYKLKYVEVIHRHHKRTPYADNTFPVESYGWDCSGMPWAHDVLLADYADTLVR